MSTQPIQVTSAGVWANTITTTIPNTPTSWTKITSTSGPVMMDGGVPLPVESQNMTGIQLFHWFATRLMVRQVQSLRASDRVRIVESDNWSRVQGRMLKALLLARINDTAHSEHVDLWTGLVKTGDMGMMKRWSMTINPFGLLMHEIAPYRAVLDEDELVAVHNEASYQWRQHQKKKRTPTPPTTGPQFYQSVTSGQVWIPTYKLPPPAKMMQARSNIRT